MFKFTLLFHWTVVFAIVASNAITGVAAKHKALIFGASGAVGSEVLQALLLQTEFWEEIIVVGRRELPLEKQTSKVSVTQVVVPDQTGIDKNTRLLDLHADACFITVGVPHPYQGSLRYWHSVEVEMALSIARLCEGMQARYIALLSAIDSENGPEPFTDDELQKSDGPLGWWGMLTRYSRMKGLAELAIQSGNIPLVSLFQPSNLVTKDIRYGWLDWTIFKLLPFLDPILPEKYHSVPVRLLGMAFAGDALERLQNQQESGQNVTSLTYGDYIRISSVEFQMQLEGKDGTEL